MIKANQSLVNMSDKRNMSSCGTIQLEINLAQKQKKTPSPILHTVVLVYYYYKFANISEGNQNYIPVHQMKKNCVEIIGTYCLRLLII